MSAPVLAYGAEDWDRIGGYLPDLARGAVMTLGISLLSLALATVIGMAVAIGWRSSRAPVRWLVSGYVQVGRAVPELVQVFIWYYTLANYGIVLPPLLAGTVALAVAFGPYLGEVFRAGVDAVEPSQWEAGEVLGMKRPTLWRRVILPQAVRTVLPVWTGYFISIFKATSLLSFISIPEVFSIARNLASQDFRYFDLFAMVMLFYLAMGVPTVLLLRRLSKSWTPRYGRPVGTSAATDQTDTLAMTGD